MIAVEVCIGCDDEALTPDVGAGCIVIGALRTDGALDRAAVLEMLVEFRIGVVVGGSVGPKTRMVF